MKEQEYRKDSYAANEEQIYTSIYLCKTPFSNTMFSSESHLQCCFMSLGQKLFSLIFFLLWQKKQLWIGLGCVCASISVLHFAGIVTLYFLPVINFNR